MFQSCPPDKSRLPVPGGFLNRIIMERRAPNAIMELVRRKAAEFPAHNGKQAQAYPGQNYGLTIDDVQKIAQNTVRKKGFTIAVAANTPQPTPITLIGTAKVLLGIVISMDDTTVNAINTLDVDEDTVLNGVSYTHLTRDATRSSYKEDYYPINKLITGQSSINLTITSTGATNARVTFVFI